jgi:hypothetical protein
MAEPETEPKFAFLTQEELEGKNLPDLLHIKYEISGDNLGLYFNLNPDAKFLRFEEKEIIIRMLIDYIIHYLCDPDAKKFAN